MFSLGWYQYSLLCLCASAIHLTTVVLARLQLGKYRLICEWPKAEK